MSLDRDPAKARAWEQRSRQRALERSREKSQGKPRRRGLQGAKPLTPEQRAVRQAVFDRDRGCQLRHLVGRRDSAGTEVPRCSGPPTPHHRRKAIEGGAYSLANLVEACAGHNGWIEDAPDAVAELAPHLVVRSGHPEYVQLGRRAQREGTDGG